MLYTDKYTQSLIFSNIHTPTFSLARPNLQSQSTPLYSYIFTYILIYLYTCFRREITHAAEKKYQEQIACPFSTVIGKIFGKHPEQQVFKKEELFIYNKVHSPKFLALLQNFLTRVPVSGCPSSVSGVLSPKGRASLTEHRGHTAVVSPCALYSNEFQLLLKAKQNKKISSFRFTPGAVSLATAYLGSK